MALMYRQLDEKNLPPMSERQKELMPYAKLMRFSRPEEIDYAINKYKLEQLNKIDFSIINKNRDLILSKVLQEESVSNQDQDPKKFMQEFYKNNTYWITAGSFKAENPQAQPLDKSQETLKFIREIDRMDTSEINTVKQHSSSKIKVPYNEYTLSDDEDEVDFDDMLENEINDELDIVFDEHDFDIVFDEHDFDNIFNDEGEENYDFYNEYKPLSGLAVVDKHQGIIGYCIYDKEEKTITDIAVHPEYKTPTTQKLFREIFQELSKKGINKVMDKEEIMNQIFGSKDDKSPKSNAHQQVATMLKNQTER